MQAAGITQRPRTIWSSSPLRRLGSVATVAAAGGSGASAPLLRVRACEAVFAVREKLGGWLGLLAVGFVALLGDLLLVGCLLREDDFADFAERFELDAPFVNHVFNLDHAGQT